MHLIYTTRGQVHKGLPGAYRNAGYFDKADKRATSVTLVGDFPHIAEAYKALDIDVSVAEFAPHDADFPDIKKMTVDKLRQFLDDNNIDYSADDKKTDLVELASGA